MSAGTSYRRLWWIFGLSVGLLACGGNRTNNRQTRTANNAPEQRVSAMRGSELPEDDRGRCTTEGENLEVSEYDTSGDDHPDVRRVFRRIGRRTSARLILICREVDLNGDGIKDVVRHYNDEGRPLREEADRDFDGVTDIILFFQNGRIVRREVDTNHDGRVDQKLFYESGRLIRTERDIAGRSTATSWRPDRWEYFENGRMVRMGTDLDGDGTVDRWDRDAEWHREQQEEQTDDAVDEGVRQAEEGADTSDAADGA